MTGMIPCQATSSLGVLDELFKAHYMFNLPYDESLVQCTTSLQQLMSLQEFVSFKQNCSPRFKKCFICQAVHVAFSP